MFSQIETENIIDCIARKKLPLVPEQLERTKMFCREQIEIGNLKVLGGIPDILRKDWLDESLDDFTRACRHTNVIPEKWHRALEYECSRTVCECGRWKGQTLALLMWRGALAYTSTLYSRDIKFCHMEAKRDEKTLEITVPMPLCKKDERLLKNWKYNVIVPDPMLATGSSFAFAIDMLNGFGVPNEKITGLCVVAAPEGTFHIFNCYPGVKIIAAALDGRLNKNAYIAEPGSGDVGEKYFYGNSIANFSRIRHLFYNAQWKRLNYLLEQVNRK